MSTLDDLVDYFSPGLRERGTGLRSGFEPVASDQGKRRHPVSQVDPRLVEAINVASQDFPYEVRLDSGYRRGDKRFHGKHKALDVELWKDGKKLSDYQDPTHFAAYEQFAQRVRGAQQQLYPELEQNLRWGGYFSGGKGKYGALDLMHFDLGGSSKLGMAGGSWEGGLTPQQARIWGISNSRGMGGQTPQGTGPMGPPITRMRRDIRQNFGSPTVDDLVATFSPHAPKQSPSTSSGGLHPNVVKAFQFYQSKGLSPNQAAGVVGSLMQESGPNLDPNARNPLGAYGIAQWTDVGNRKGNMISAGGKGDLDKQLEYSWQELTGAERGALGRIQKAGSFSDAAVAHRKYYERPGADEARDDKRIGYAQQVFSTLSEPSAPNRVPGPLPPSTQTVSVDDLTSYFSR